MKQEPVLISIVCFCLTNNACPFISYALFSRFANNQSLTLKNDPLGGARSPLRFKDRDLLKYLRIAIDVC